MTCMILDSYEGKGLFLCFKFITKYECCIESHILQIFKNGNHIHVVWGREKEKTGSHLDNTEVMLKGEHCTIIWKKNELGKKCA